MAALIWDGETWKLCAICGSEVEMMEESSPSMKKAPAMTVGTIRDICALGGWVRPESNSVTNKDGRSMRCGCAFRQAARVEESGGVAVYPSTSGQTPSYRLEYRVAARQNVPAHITARKTAFPKTPIFR